MKLQILFFTAMSMLLLMAAGCASRKVAQEVPAESRAVGWSATHVVATDDTSATLVFPAVNQTGGLRGSGRVNHIPKARIYKTNGDYAANVPVSLNSARTALVSYPAPTDLVDCQPVALADGFLLDRRGIGPNTAFTKWNYAEYTSLPAAPSPSEIMGSLIPGARITALYEMPFPITTPDAPSLCDSLIRLGLPGCRPLLPVIIK